MINQNKLLFGIILGLISPLFLYGIYFFVEKNMEIYITENFAKIICIAVNGLLFSYYIKKELDNSAKGILAITFLYAIAYFWTKLF